MTDRDEGRCAECGDILEGDEVFLCDDCSYLEDEDDFLVGFTCNPDDPEECESCQ